MSWRPPGADRLSVRRRKVRFCIWLRAIDDSTLNSARVSICYSFSFMYSLVAFCLIVLAVMFGNYLEKDLSLVILVRDRWINCRWTCGWFLLQPPFAVGDPFVRAPSSSGYVPSLMDNHAHRPPPLMERSAPLIFNFRSRKDLVLARYGALSRREFDPIKLTYMTGQVPVQVDSHRL